MVFGSELIAPAISAAVESMKLYTDFKAKRENYLKLQFDVSKEIEQRRLELLKRFTISYNKIVFEISDPYLNPQLVPFAIEQANDLYTATKEADFSLIEMKIVRIEAALAANDEFKASRAHHRRLAVIFATAIILLLVVLVIASPKLGLSTETIVPLIKIPFPIIIWSAIGSLGAMLYRFNNSADAELADPLRWSFTRPLTGILMGIIAYMTFKIGLLVLQPGTIPGRTPGVVPSTSEELLWLAAFLAGFSDRFADSVLRSLTGRLGGDRQAELQAAEQMQTPTGGAIKALADRLGLGKPSAALAISQTIDSVPTGTADENIGTGEIAAAARSAAPQRGKSSNKKPRTKPSGQSRDRDPKAAPPDPGTVVAFPDNAPKENI
jgi:hypothetical protein